MPTQVGLNPNEKEIRYAAIAELDLLVKETMAHLGHRPTLCLVRAVGGEVPELLGVRST